MEPEPRKTPIYIFVAAGGVLLLLSLLFGFWWKTVNEFSEGMEERRKENMFEEYATSSIASSNDLEIQ